MSEYTAFMWTLAFPRHSRYDIKSSQYLLIDRLVINIESAPDGDTRAVATLKDDSQMARDVALGLWVVEDERQGLVFEGVVMAATVEADLEDLVNAHSYWSSVSPHLRALVTKIEETGVPL